MSAVLRVYGVNFDVDAFLIGCDLPVCAVKRRGEPVLPNTQPNGRRYDHSGVHVVASDAEFDEFPRQVQETLTFLKQHTLVLRRLCEFPGVASASIDFGVARRDVAVPSDTLPAELLRLAVTLGLDIEVSQYSARGATRQD